MIYSIIPCYYDNNTPNHADFTESVNYDQNWNGNINGTVADYKLDAASITNTGALTDEFDKATVYGFNYDLVNRLYQADANAGDRVTGAIASYGIGDAEYNYDRIGNITNLKRGLELDGSDLVNEEWVYKKTYLRKSDAEISIFKWIETWYNRNRRYSALNYKTIIEFELETSNHKHAA